MSNVVIKGLDGIRTAGFRPEVVGCFLFENKLLFLYKKEHDLWQFPQGGIKNNETPGDALVREMTEELGGEFVDNCSDTAHFFYSDEISFKTNDESARILQDDSGKKVKMIGKHYLFFYIITDTGYIDISKTEFDSYEWEGYEKSIGTVNNIYQVGKKRIYKKAIAKLNELELLK